MANIKNLEMAEAVFNHPSVTTVKPLFGLCQTTIYTPTQSAVKAFRLDYDAEAAAQLERVLKASPEELDDIVPDLGIKPADMGNVRLEGCKSADRQFAALQLLRFSDFEYRPVTDVRFYEGRTAEIICAMLS